MDYVKSGVMLLNVHIMEGVSDMANVERMTKIHGAEAKYLGMQYGLEIYRTADNGVVNIYGVSYSKAGDYIMISLKIDTDRNIILGDLGD